MIISGGRNYIFVHIPKTGGTSMALALEGRAMKDDILIGDTPKALKRRQRLKEVKVAGRLWKHSTLADIEGLVTQQQIRRAFTFTLVRNPWDRLVSYYYWLQAQRFDHPAVALAQERNFSEFLNDQHTVHSLQSQTYEHYMTASGGRVHCSTYIRLEHFQVDADPLWDHLGFELEMPRVNSSSRKCDYQEYYSASDRQLVAQVCKQDIDRFGYRYS